MTSQYMDACLEPEQMDI